MEAVEAVLFVMSNRTGYINIGTECICSDPVGGKSNKVKWAESKIVPSNLL